MMVDAVLANAETASVSMQNPCDGSAVSRVVRAPQSNASVLDTSRLIISVDVRTFNVDAAIRDSPGMDVRHLRTAGFPQNCIVYVAVIPVEEHVGDVSTVRTALFSRSSTASVRVDAEH